MSNGIPRTLADLRKELAELREDVHAMSSAIVLLLRRQSGNRRRLDWERRALKVVIHLQWRQRRHKVRKMRDTARTNRQ